MQEFEITRTLYDIFNRFELDDLAYLNVWDRHIEHSEVWENTLYERAVEELISVEDMIIRKLEYEAVSKAIATLPEKQKRRLLSRWKISQTNIEKQRDHNKSTDVGRIERLYFF